MGPLNLSLHRQLGLWAQRDGGETRSWWSRSAMEESSSLLKSFHMEDLLIVAKKRMKMISLYRKVDFFFAGVFQPGQACIVAYDAQYYLKNVGNFIISIKVKCIDSSVEAVFTGEVKKMVGE